MIDWRKNVEIYGTRFSESVSGRGYDRTLPVTWWSYSNTNGNAADTPAHTLTGEITFLWRSDSFESYLMFMPAGGKPVPLKLATWNWYGRAQRMDTNTPPTFVGVTPFTNPQAATGTDCFVHPTWTNNIENIKNDNWQTHVTEYPTP